MEAIGEYYHRDVGQAEVKVGVAIVDHERQLVFLARESFHLIETGSDVSEKTTRGVGAASLAKQVIRLRADRGGHNEQSRFVFKRALNGLMMRIATVTKRHDRRRVNDERQSRTLLGAALRGHPQLKCRHRQTNPLRKTFSLDPGVPRRRQWRPE